MKKQNKKDKRITIAVWEIPDSSIGLIVPRKSGVVWIHETDGVFCSKEEFEGTLISLSYPKNIYDDKDVKNKDGVFIVKKLKEKLPFNCVSIKGDFVDVTGKNRWNHEGTEWIKITGLKRGHEDLCYDTFKKLKGKKIALIYPNSD